MYGAAANSALVASRHMATYGTTSEQLAEVAVACRYHASLNPRAVMRKPITVAEHQASRWIVEPLHLLDCCLISDGGVCIIVTSEERAKDCAHPAVRIAGMGQAYSNRTLGNPDWLAMPHQKTALDAAYRTAGLGPSDVDVAQLYDNFTISVLLWLEHGGFCKPGEGGPFVEEGRIQLGGELPVNTSGGNLSESYMEGWLHVVEGVTQIRGEASDRQVPDATVCLVTGRGMSLNCANAMILTPAA
jgi:acetyl-CoA acetyltransferase